MVHITREQIRALSWLIVLFTLIGGAYGATAFFALVIVTSHMQDTREQIMRSRR